MYSNVSLTPLKYFRNVFKSDDSVYTHKPLNETSWIKINEFTNVAEVAPLSLKTARVTFNKTTVNFHIFLYIEKS